MRKAGEILAQVHEELHAAVHPGMSTLDIDKLGERLIRSMDVFLPLKITMDILHPSACP